MDLRSSRYCEGLEYVKVEPEIALAAPGNGNYQNKDNIRFILNSEGSNNPVDWYNSYLQVSFQLMKLDGTRIGGADAVGQLQVTMINTVNGIHSIIDRLRISIGGNKIYEINNAAELMNIKNLTQYTKQFSESIATEQMFYLDDNEHASNVKFTEMPAVAGGAAVPSFRPNIEAGCNEG